MGQELPSTPDVAKADDIKLKEITENAARSTEDLIAQWNDQVTCWNIIYLNFLSLDKELRSIRSSLKVETAKNFQLEERIEREKHKLFEIRDDREYDDDVREDTLGIGSKCWMMTWKSGKKV